MQLQAAVLWSSLVSLKGHFSYVFPVNGELIWAKSSGWFSVVSFIWTALVYHFFLILAGCCFGTLFLDESVDVDGQNSFQRFLAYQFTARAEKQSDDVARNEIIGTLLNKLDVSKWVEPQISCSFYSKNQHGFAVSTMPTHSWFCWVYLVSLLLTHPPRA